MDDLMGQHGGPNAKGGVGGPMEGLEEDCEYNFEEFRTSVGSDVERGHDAMPKKWYQSAVRFDIEKFDGRMFFGLWQVQVKDVLIQSGLHKMRKVWTYKEILSRWSKFG
ncbi:hypothetical protein PIB30_049002 [Stylosanthes scabra]|uniref:Uncharacterized protein n=1 Tax=Stylosanthes scabra TaxID=79078 RepID=A0ABU6ZFY2_9FABA|nr:hypothetical protein [Stylosanthes scabra]